MSPEYREYDVGGGKSGLHRTGWFLTGTGGNPRESATERRPPTFVMTTAGMPTEALAKEGKGERVR